MSLRPLPQVSSRVASKAVDAPARRRPREAASDGLAYLVCALLVGALLATTAVGAPLWTHKPASDIKWYRVTDVGSLLVGVQMETGKGDRQILFKDKEPDYQVDELAGRVFNLRNSKELSAFAVDAAPPAEEKQN